MSTQLKHKGKFIKKKVLEKRLKFIDAMRAAKEKKKLTKNSVQGDSNLCEERHILKPKELGKNLKCCKCNGILSLENVEKAIRIGLNSILWVRCKNFINIKTEPDVSTGKMHVTERNSNRSKNADVDTSIVNADGIDCRELNKILACLDTSEILNNLSTTVRTRSGTKNISSYSKKL